MRSVCRPSCTPHLREDHRGRGGQRHQGGGSPIAELLAHPHRTRRKGAGGRGGILQTWIQISGEDADYSLSNCRTCRYKVVPLWQIWITLQFMTFKSLATKRFAVRKYSDEPVREDNLEYIIDCLRLAMFPRIKHS